MRGRKAFARLLEPLQLKQVRFRNRIVKLPQDTAYSNPDGSISQRVIDFYESLAKGGVGGIILEHSAVEVPLGTQKAMISVADDSTLPGLSRLVERVHAQGCPIIQQLNHQGPMHDSSASGIPALSASALSPDYTLKTFGASLNLQALTTAGIAALVEKFALAAERSRKAGFDGVEIHAHRIYLLNSFLSPLWNKREDQYGCRTLENRTRFAVEIIKAVRERIGGDTLLGIRIKGADYAGDDKTPFEDTQQIVRMLARAGLDYVNVVVGTTHTQNYPEPMVPMARELARTIRLDGARVRVAHAVKQAVSIPVILGGRLDPALGERLLSEGAADAIGLGRLLFADPELPRKLAEGRENEIVPCTGCNTCLDRYLGGGDVACQINATLGKGLDDIPRPAKRRKRIVVAGGGPAGMEAARVAARRGHDVTLFEKSPSLGGCMPLAVLTQEAEHWRVTGFINYLQDELQRSGVRVSLGESLTAEMIERLKPDAVIVAIGGKPSIPDIPGIERSNVMTRERLERYARLPLRVFGPDLTRKLSMHWLPIGRRVAIVGGLMHGCEMAEFLVKRGRQVTIVEQGSAIGTGILDLYRGMLINWLDRHGTAILAEARCKAVTHRGLVVIRGNGAEQTVDADTIVLALAPEPNVSLERALKGKVAEVYSIGDCNAPGRVMDAVAAGFEAGCLV